MTKYQYSRTCQKPYFFAKIDYLIPNNMKQSIFESDTRKNAGGQVCDGDVVFGAELFGTLRWIDGTSLKDFGPIVNFCEFAPSQFAAGQKSLSAMTHKKVYGLTEELHIMNTP